ncbi:transmembrane protein 192 isoform 3-T3 [Lycaon pictus]
MAARGRMEDGSLDLTQSIEDDPLLDTHHLPHHSLHAHFRPRFHPLPTVIIANLLLLIHVVFVILAFLTGILCSYPNPIEDKCPGNYTNPLKVQTVIILGKVILWILHFLLERYIQYHHNKVRNRGYTMIYLSTRHLKGLALLIHSTGSTALLLVLSVQHSFPAPARLYLYLVLAILALELLCSLTCLLIYTETPAVKKLTGGFHVAQYAPLPILDLDSHIRVHALPNALLYMASRAPRTFGSFSPSW